MERNIELITIQTIRELPSIDYISNLPRHKKLRLIFKNSVQHLREDFGADLKKKFPDFQIAIHTIEHEINICKLIMDEEIIANQIHIKVFNPDTDFEKRQSKLTRILEFLNLKNNKN